MRYRYFCTKFCPLSVYISNAETQKFERGTSDLQFCILASVKKKPCQANNKHSNDSLYKHKKLTFKRLTNNFCTFSRTVICCQGNEGQIKSAFSSVTFHHVLCQVRAGLVFLSVERALLRTAFAIRLRSMLLNAICSKPGPDYVPHTVLTHRHFISYPQ